jgi:hypothetical protein
MFVRTYPSVAANAADRREVSLPVEVSPVTSGLDLDWDSINRSYLSAGREVQVEMETLKAEEASVALKGSP